MAPNYLEAFDLVAQIQELFSKIKVIR